MTRPLRVEYPGAFYHVFSRGNAGEHVFKGDADKKKFLQYLAKDVERFSIILHTYCIMSNHYHLLIETPLPNLSVAIQWLNISYAAYYNKRHQRSGHIFQGRYKSILIDKDDYIKQLSRYIHLNPVRAKLVSKPLDYQWSSYSAFIEKAKDCDWLETSGILQHFGKKRKQSKANYKIFVEEVDVESIENPNKDLVGGFILGDDEFVKWVYNKFVSSRKENKEIPQQRKIRPGISIDEIVNKSCIEFGCKKDYILKRDSKRNIARDYSCESAKNIGGYLGGISGAAITLKYKSVFNKSCKDNKLKTNINKIKNQILNTLNI